MLTDLTMSRTQLPAWVMGETNLYGSIHPGPLLTGGSPNLLGMVQGLWVDCKKHKQEILLCVSYRICVAQYIADLGSGIESHVMHIRSTDMFH